MRKIFFGAISLLLAGSICLAGCSKGPGSSEGTGSDSSGAAAETEYDLVRDGQTDYTIVLPDSPSQYQKIAAVELTTFFARATGIELTTVSDLDVVLTPDGKYLSIGENELFGDAGLSPEENFKTSGYLVKTVGQSVFMAGGQYGDLYAVYEFLRQQFDYECYAVDEIKLETNVRNKKLLDFDVVDIPDIDLRVNNYGEARFNAAYSRRLRMNSFEDIWVNLGGTTFHNFFETVPKEIYQEEHPDWYSTDGKQLCLTRDTENLARVVAEKIKEALDENRTASAVSFTAEDVYAWCTCSECTAMREKYGTDAASYIKFINIVAKDVKEWLAEEQPGREVKIAIFAYMKTEEAPVTQDADGTYRPIDDSVVLEDNVVCLYAPINANYYYDFYNAENATYANTLKAWSALADSIYLWSYSTYFGNYLLPYDNFNSMQGIYRFAYENGVEYCFDQGQYNQTTVSTDWGRLKLYLNSKLQWDCSLNMQALIDDWFENYFKDAAEPMQAFFNAERTYYTYLVDEKNISGVTAGYPNSLLNRTSFPQGVLSGFLGYIDEAYAAIEPLAASDPALWEKLCDRINLESISLRYLYWYLYKGTMTAAAAESYKEALYSDCLKLSVGRYSEASDITSYFG